MYRCDTQFKYRVTMVLCTFGKVFQAPSAYSLQLDETSSRMHLQGFELVADAQIMMEKSR